MGKTGRWFRALLGGAKKSSDSGPAKEKEKKTWGLVRSLKHNGEARGSSTEASSSSLYLETVDANKHAIAVAAATAAVAEAALAAAQAAAEVVRLTSGGCRPPTAYVGGSGRGGDSDRRRELGAVRIQSAFRAYLARRALRALKGLVKLQALVRGHIVRKQSADMLRRMQAMARIQARACATRAYTSESSQFSNESSQSRHLGVATPRKYDHQLHAYGTKPDGSILKRCGSKSNIKDNLSLERSQLDSNWLDHWMEQSSWSSRRDTSLKNRRADDEKNDKILEVDTWKPQLKPKRSDRTFRTSQYTSAWNQNEQDCAQFYSLSRHSTKSQKPNLSLFSGEVSSLRSLNFPLEVDQAAVWIGENSPQVCSASSRPGSSGRGGPFTPARSECARRLFGDCLSHPNYMANTESSQAKVRSQSAPRQRIQYEKPSSTKRFVRGYWDAETTISERSSTFHTNLSTGGYPGSGRLATIGTPVHREATGYDATYGS